MYQVPANNRSERCLKSGTKFKPIRLPVPYSTVVVVVATFVAVIAADFVVVTAIVVAVELRRRCC